MADEGYLEVSGDKTAFTNPAYDMSATPAGAYESDWPIAATPSTQAVAKSGGASSGNKRKFIAVAIVSHALYCVCVCVCVCTRV